MSHKTWKHVCGCVLCVCVMWCDQVVSHINSKFQLLTCGSGERQQACKCALLVKKLDSSASAILVSIYCVLHSWSREKQTHGYWNKTQSKHSWSRRTLTDGLPEGFVSIAESVTETHLHLYARKIHIMNSFKQYYRTGIISVWLINTEKSKACGWKMC